MEILKIYLEEQRLVKYCVIKHLILLKILDMMDIKEHKLQWFIGFLIKNCGCCWKNEIMQNKEVTEELHKTIIRKFEKLKVHSSFIDNIWGADLVDMQLLSKCSRGICFFVCAIDDYSKYAWVIPLKDRKGITITNFSQRSYM